MSTKKIILINGHPAPSSLSKSMAEAYQSAAENKGHIVRFHDISNMAFDMDYGASGYTNVKPLEPDLEALLQDLEWADHVVLTTPLWWGDIPAKLKGALDRALLPGRAFDTRNTTALGFPMPMLTGKTARVLMTADTPAWIERLMYSNAIKKVLTRQVFGFIGIKPTKFNWFAPASHADAETVKKWLGKVAQLGAQAA